MSGLFSKSGIAQSPTPIAIFALGNDFLKPLSKGVATRTSPRSLLRRTNIDLGGEFRVLFCTPSIFLED